MAMILLPKELQANSTPQIKIDPKKPLIVTNTIDSEPRPTPVSYTHLDVYKRQD